MAAGIAATWIAAQLAGNPPSPDSARPPDAPPEAPTAAPSAAPSAEPAPAAAPPAPAPAAIGPAFDDDAAMPAHADGVVSYTLEAKLDPDKHTISGSGTIAWRNASTVPESEIWLHLYLNAFKNDRTYFMRFAGGDSFRGSGGLTDWGYVRVERLAVHDGPDLWPSADKTSPGDPEDETDIRVPLPEPVAPGASILLDVAFESRLPSIMLRTGFAGGFHMAGQWFPKIARLEPDGRWAHFPFHRLSEFYADFGAYDVTIDTPDGMVVGATGQLASEVRANGRVARRYVQDDVHDFAFTAWSDFQEIDARSDDGVELRLLFPPDHERDAEVELESVRYGLSYLGKAFGRYPYKTLTVVHPPDNAEEAGGMEYPTLITTGGPWWLPETGVRAIDIVTIHELGHQWFYGLVATDEHGWPFLDEGINSYAEYDSMEAWRPGDSAFAGLGLRVGLPATNRAGSADAVNNAPVAQPAPAFMNGGEYGALVYARTATILATMANVYGADKVRRAIGRYTRRYRFQHPVPEDLLGAVREVVGDDAADQMRVALFDRGTVDYVVADIASEPDDPVRGIVGDPASPTKPEAPADKDAGYRGNVLVRRRGALRFPVDVEMIGADGSKERVRWDAAERAARLPWHGKSRLAAAVIDPDHRILLDDDLGNNARRTSSSNVSGALLDRLSFYAETILAGVLP
jgi:hypothetical protein